MEVFLVPALLLFTGLTLIFLGAHGAPTLPWTLRSARIGAGRSERGAALLDARLAGMKAPAAPRTPALAPARPRSLTAFTESDALLGQLLSEMSSVRDEIRDLRSKLDGIAPAPAPEPRKRSARRVATA